MCNQTIFGGTCNVFNFNLTHEFIYFKKSLFFTSKFIVWTDGILHDIYNSNNRLLNRGKERDQCRN